MRFSQEPADIVKFCNEKGIIIKIEPESYREFSGTYRVTINSKDYFKSVRQEIEKSWKRSAGGMYHKKDN
jgi:hypothetical protein